MVYVEILKQEIIDSNYKGMIDSHDDDGDREGSSDLPVVHEAAIHLNNSCY